MDCAYPSAAPWSPCATTRPPAPGLSWIEWNNLDIAGVIFAILVVGVVGVILDAGFNKLAGFVTYQE